ncbi:FtsX-like permease family protein [Enterococcus nangangensis]|uniref:FtsX-like permease family protein n=1 Tax=Enterococcus nangangensis TaxID=2559926 RepID=UPI0010F8A824|nr:FtsX-like permease family protein [Enterococcus nangangensis]
MKKNVYLRSTFRDIRRSLGRFVAITIIILLGVLLFVGIKAVGPDLEATADDYFDSQKLSDLQIIGSAGLTETDRTLALENGATTAELGYRQAYVDTSTNAVVQLYSYHVDSQENHLEVVTGRLPQAADEIVLDVLAQDFSSLKIGDPYTIEDDELDLAQTEYTIVGFVQSPIYLDTATRGTTNVGDGNIDYFAYLPAENFQSDIYSILYLSFSNLAKYDTFGASYQDKTEAWQDKLTTAFKTRSTVRQEELQAAATAELAPKKAELTDAETQLAAGQAQLTTAENNLAAQKAQLAQQKVLLTQQYGAEVAEAQLADAYQQLSDGETQLAQQQADLTAKQQELADTKVQLADGEAKIAELAKPTYYLNLREDNPGYTEYATLATQLNAIADIFPVFFFLIAILITFTTMTRMIEENRREIGILKALGYRKREIASKYILYAILATVIGVTLGVVIGSNFIPWILFVMIQKRFVFDAMVLGYYPLFILLATLAGLLATLGALGYILRKELKEKPASLMQAKAPKGGQRIFLERIKPLWSRLNFNQKVSYRNLFRYKARMVLTIFGIAGCTGLMLAGFGIKESISAPIHRQFANLTHYQALVTLDTDVTDLSKVEDLLTAKKEITQQLATYQKQITLETKELGKQNVTVLVPQDAQEFKEYVTLKAQKGGQTFTLPETGAVLSQKLAKAMKLCVGDTFKIEIDEESYSLKVAQIAENYLGHSIWFSKAYYQDIFAEDFKANSYIVKTTELTSAAEEDLAKELNATGDVVNTTYIATQMTKQLANTDNLAPVVWIFIILSGTLAFVVLYNLTNINISERVRELATIKVLGFFDREVTMYILRENIIFTLFGILFGFGIGNLLTYAILKMAETSEIVFPLVIPLSGYVISGLLTFAFSAIVLGVTHFKLREINMIEALKSNE